MNRTLRFLLGVGIVAILAPAAALAMPDRVLSLLPWHGDTTTASGPAPALAAVEREIQPEETESTSAPTTLPTPSTQEIPASETESSPEAEVTTTSEEDPSHHNHGSSGTDSTASQADPTSTTSTSNSQSSGTITGEACPCTVIGTVELKGQVNLRGDLVVDGGTLVARPGVKVNGNGHEIIVMHSGVLDWKGTPKSGWVEWGESVSGWKSGDRLAVAPLANGDFDVHDDTWTGSWNDVSPSTAKLSDGRTVRAEVANLDRDIVIDNVARIMFHMGAGKQTIKHVAVRNSGVAGELGFYPIHFHLNKDTVRGSLVEGVVVENGNFHAFVPHGSKGVTFRDVAAVNTTDDAYWWDKPTKDDSSNNSHGIIWKHALALGVEIGETRGGGFQMGAGTNNTCVDCHAAAIRGGKDTAGFIWPEFRGGASGDGVWLFESNVAHNNISDGIFVWQNTSRDHVIADTLLYRNARAGIDHGAYGNGYQYENIDSFENGRYGFKNRAFGSNCDEGDHNLVRFFDITSDGPLLILQHHKEGFDCPAEYYRLDISGVIVDEQTGDAGISRFYDSNLTPDDFEMVSPRPKSIFQIYESGDLVYEWAGGSWSTK